MLHAERLDGTKSLMDNIMAMAEGNPGALKVCVSLLKRGKNIDPDDLFEGFGTLMALDTLGIYSYRIWMLYSDVCGEDLVKLVAIARAWQLGQLLGASKEAINHAIDNRGAGLDLDAIMVAVQRELPSFNRAENAHLN